MDGLEDIQQYPKGGFHTVHLGDILDGRFEVIHKLGSGRFGIVWLCQESQSKRWRAVKIFTADQSSKGRELQTLQHLAGRFSTEELAKHHIATPLEMFWINGPNGRHLCFVMPVLGCNVFNWRGVCHGDFRPHNILMQLKGIDDLSQDTMMKLIGQNTEQTSKFINSEDEDSDGEDSIIIHVGTYPGEGLDPSGLKYCVKPVEFDWCADLVTEEPIIVVFGESFLAAEPVKTTGIPTIYAAPEILFSTKTAGFGSDIWSLACTVSQVWSGNIPFGVRSGGISDMVRDFELRLGPLPEPYRTAWKDSPNRASKSEGGECGASSGPFSEAISPVSRH